MASLPDLRRQIEDAKRTIAETTENLRDLQELVAIIERAQGNAHEEQAAPSILVAADQFRGARATDAIRRVLTANPERSFRVGHLVDALYRGGQSPSRVKIRQNVAAFMKYAREREWLIPSDEPQSYKLSDLGRRHFSSAVSRPGSLFPSAAGE
jgi:hypothetical protein